MTPTHAPDVPPVPVVRLEYADPADDPWRAVAAITGGVSWAVLLRAALATATSGLWVVCWAWQNQTVPGIRRQIDTAPVAIGILGGILDVVLLAAAVKCVRGREAGRRMVVATSVVQAAVDPLLVLASGGYFQVTRRYFLYGSAFVALQWGSHAAAILYSAGLSIATILFYRQPAVRRFFARP